MSSYIDCPMHPQVLIENTTCISGIICTTNRLILLWWIKQKQLQSQSWTSRTNLCNSSSMWHITSDWREFGVPGVNSQQTQKSIVNVRGQHHQGGISAPPGGFSWLVEWLQLDIHPHGQQPYITSILSSFNCCINSFKQTVLRRVMKLVNPVHLYMSFCSYKSIHIAAVVVGGSAI